MADAEVAPAQYKQPSRKGKKAWRKNVDVTEIQSGLEEVRSQIIQGGVIAERPSDQLFTVDTIGCSDTRKQVAKRHKLLKVDEILAQRSAVPAVPSRKRLSDIKDESKRKKARISSKDYDRLRAIAYGGDQVKKDVVKTGGTVNYDLWSVPQVKKDPKFSFLEEKKAKTVPATLKHASVSQARDGNVIPAVRKPSGGKSYNPRFEDWQKDFNRESEKAVEEEKKRFREAREEVERKERAAVEAEPDSAEESVWESEWEGFSDDEETLLKQKRPERKTIAQRNKIKRRKEAERRAKHDAKTMVKVHQEQDIERIAKSVEREEEEQAKSAVQKALATNQADPLFDGEDEGLKSRKKQLGKVPIPEAPLEIVLPDELRDSLRLLKPEGNLLKDRFRSIMLQGKMEARRQIPYAKQKKYVVTEKWSYKDWALK